MQVRVRYFYEQPQGLTQRLFLQSKEHGVEELQVFEIIIDHVIKLEPLIEI
jgi:hypothetical protein